MIVASGFCGHGFAIGPIVGRYLAQWAATGEKPEAFAPFRRSRFDSWLQTKWTPTGSFEAVLATESTQVKADGHGTLPTPAESASPLEEAGSKFLMIDPSKCTGCRMCEMACSIHNYQLARQTQLRIQVAYLSDAAYSPVMCVHCEEMFCKDACPVDALVFDETTHAIRVIDENCTACLLCVEACPYGGITYAEDKGVVIKCDSCGGDPACASHCAPARSVSAR